jgi:hypothetical protein
MRRAQAQPHDEVCNGRRGLRVRVQGSYLGMHVTSECRKRVVHKRLGLTRIHAEAGGIGEPQGLWWAGRIR